MPPVVPGFSREDIYRIASSAMPSMATVLASDPVA